MAENQQDKTTGAVAERVRTKRDVSAPEPKTVTTGAGAPPAELTSDERAQLASQQLGPGVVETPGQAGDDTSMAGKREAPIRKRSTLIVLALIAVAALAAGLIVALPP